MNIKLGDLLVRAKVISDGQLKAALAEQKKWGGKLGEILVRMEFCSEEIVVKALAKQLGIQTADVEAVEVSPLVLQKAPLKAVEDLDLVPLQLKDDGKTLVVAVSDPSNVESLDTLRARTGCRIIPLLAGATAIARARARIYYGEADLDSGGEAGFKVTDAQGRTMVKDIRDIRPPPGYVPPAPKAAPAPQPAVAARPPPPVAAADPSQLLDALEQVQRKEVSVLKAMVELLVEKGVFTREEYLARIKR